MKRLFAAVLLFCACGGVEEPSQSLNPKHTSTESFSGADPINWCFHLSTNSVWKICITTSSDDPGYGKAFIALAPQDDCWHVGDVIYDHIDGFSQAPWWPVHNARQHSMGKVSGDTTHPNCAGTDTTTNIQQTCDQNGSTTCSQYVDSPTQAWFSEEKIFTV